MSGPNLPLGKLPSALLAELLEANPIHDPRVLVGPGIGLDCAVLELGDRLLVLKSDPITFTTDEIGWYLVQINANDIATTGGQPKWLLATLLLPEELTTREMTTNIQKQIVAACEEIGVTLIGGHTEITHGLNRPLAIGTMIGEVGKEDLVTSRGAHPGDRILITKGLAIETTAIAAREFPDLLSPYLSLVDVSRAAEYLRNPGISVLRDAQIAVQAGKVTAMHDPTEGGVAAALWELAEACGLSLLINRASVPISTLSQKICQILDLDPMATLSSGSLLLTVSQADSVKITGALVHAGIQCADIGRVETGLPSVQTVENGRRVELPRPERDAIARLYEN